MKERPSLISVVIPCHNGVSILENVLLGLIDQTLSSDQFEAFLVDDGSTDDIEGMFLSLDLPQSFHYIHQHNQGAAVARNRGAKASKGEIIVFIDSDVTPDRPLLEEHLNAHIRHPGTLMVGRTRPARTENRDIFHEVMAEKIFAFDLGDEECHLPFQDLVSRNLSMPRSIFIELGGFDERYPRSGYEDTEFALRAVKAGYKLLYSPTASGEHRHFGNLEQVGQHMYNYQISAAMLFSQHPEARGQVPHLRDKEPIAWGEDPPRLLARKIMRYVFSLPPIFGLMRKAINVLERMNLPEDLMRILYWQVLGTYLYRGYREGRKRYRLDS